MNTTDPNQTAGGGIRALIARELAPLAARIDQDGVYPEAFLHELGAAGGFGAAIPQKFGGQGRQLADQIAVTTAVGAECGSTAFIVWCQSVSAWYLLHTPNAATRERYLGPVARGELLSGSGMSNAVKHLAGIEKIHLRARHDGDGYRIDGVLPWVSNLGENHLLIAAAEVPGEGYIMFAVPCNAPGLGLNPCPEFSGMEGTRTLNPRFHDVRIDADGVLAHPRQFREYLACIKPGFVLGQAGMGLGVAAGCIASVHKFNVGHSVTNGYLDEQEGPLRADLDALTARTAALAARVDAGEPVLLEVLQARAAASELALRAANAAVLHAGARGYLVRSPVQRRLREAVFVSIVTPALKHLRKEIHDLEVAPLQAVAA
ncbi:MAG TPA: acyl-CoA dehydrogenase family protein [Rhodanobacteraceae bacterium]|nr:acyl-CoA dehydrogenase family protein [Rhodanobacteraceae bacterium]